MSTYHHPKFNQIHPDTLVKSLEIILAHHKTQFEKLLSNFKFTAPDWSFMRQLDALDDQVTQFWAPVRHLNAVCENETLRKAYQTCLSMLTEWGVMLHQNIDLYQALSTLAAHPEFKQQTVALQTLIQHTLRGFRLAGVDLEASKKQRYKQLQTHLSEQGAQFEANILDASEAGALIITDLNRLKGLPATFIDMVAFRAKEYGSENSTAGGITGWRLNLEEPCYHAVMTLAEDRTLREEMYRAWTTRASDLTHSAFNNTPLMEKILTQRSELSHLLGFENYAALSLATDKMAKSTQEVIEFLTQLIQLAKPKALEDLQVLQHFAQTENLQEIDLLRKQYSAGNRGETPDEKLRVLGVNEHRSPSLTTSSSTRRHFAEGLMLCAWDIPYFSERLCAQKFGSNEELLRPYFPIKRVLEGLFKCLSLIFQLNFKPIQWTESWHPSVQVFAVYDSENTLRGTVYLDLYARARKREGAWVDECQSRRRLENGALQLPMVFLTCNFSAPTANQPALLTHEEVITLFHEMGHALHHVLTQIDYTGVSGTQGVPWDAVEFPSQFLECFAWEPEVLNLISGHYQTGETLPIHHIQAIQSSRLFQMGLSLMKQLELSLFDFSLHLKFNSQTLTKNQIQTLLNEVRLQTSVVSTPAFNYFQNSFSHIFSDSYAAGYYSYLWAEVLAADAFGRFKESGIFNPQVGKEFLQTILEPGGSVDIIELFKQFRGRSPNLEAFLIQRGLKI